MSGKRIMDIELLRGIAVLGVLFHHLQGSLFTDSVPTLEKIHAWAQPWWGVDLFFAISGFVIARSLIPALFSMPLAFLVIVVVSKLDRSPRAAKERAAFDDQFVRAQTGLGAAAASNH